MWRVPEPGVRASIVGFAAAVLSLAALLVRGELFARQPVLIVVQALAFALMVWARVTFGRRSFHLAANPTAGDLVTWGPYRYWRHPIYAAIIFFVWAGVARHFSLRALLLAAVATDGLVTRMMAEERLLKARYPEYRDYASRTSRLIPGFV